MQFLVNYTLTFNANYILFLVSSLLFLLSGYILKIFTTKVADFVVFLIPSVAVYVFGYFANVFLFPFYFPVSFLFSVSGFLIGVCLKSPVNRKRIFLSFSLLLLIIYYLGFVVSPPIQYNNSITPPSVYSTIMLKDFGLFTLEGDSLPSKELHGKVVLLNFTSKVCGQCIQKQPYLEELTEKYKDQKDLLILEVDLGKYDTLEEARKFAKNGNNTLRWAYDPKNQLAYQLFFQGGPHEVLIDKNGKVQHIQAGFNAEYALVYVDFLSKKIDAFLAFN